VPAQSFSRQSSAAASLSTFTLGNNLGIPRNQFSQKELICDLLSMLRNAGSCIRWELMGDYYIFQIEFNKI
jgi:hypothetical protein